VACRADSLDTDTCDERVLCASLDARIADQPGVLRLCLPLGAVSRLLRDEKRSASAAGSRSAAPQAAASGPIADTPVPLSAQLGPATASLAAVLKLQPGDVLDLRLPATSLCTLHCGGLARFRAMAGVSQGRVALQLVEELAG
jgi:flagellar motor switch protein FliM